VVIICVLIALNMLLGWTADHVLMSKSPQFIGGKETSYYVGGVLVVILRPVIVIATIVGLLRMRQWARMLAIVLNCMGFLWGCFALVIATVLGAGAPLVAAWMALNLTIIIWLACIGQDFAVARPQWQQR